MFDGAVLRASQWKVTRIHDEAIGKLHKDW
jgi:DNA-directed RNA polymerase specialized sigma subunit